LKSPCLKKNQEGFTLVELLVVVGIVVYLWIVMVNLFKGKIFLAKKVTCEATLQTIQGQLELRNARLGKFPQTQKEFQHFLKNWYYFTKTPECPFGWPYTLNLKTGLVEKHHHNLKDIF